MTGRRKLTLERTWQATVAEVWRLWTTKEGLESFWGPEGFSVEVHTLDLRPGGALEYAMTASAPEQIAFMQRAGLPLTVPQRLTYTEVVPLRRLAWELLADFIPGTAPYPAATRVELFPDPQGVRMVLTFDAMHDEEWTRRSVLGRESELGKLLRVSAARRPPG